MTRTSNLTAYGATTSDRADPGDWFLTKDEPLLAEYVNFLFHNFTEDILWALDRLNALDPDEDGQAEDAYTLRGQSPSEVGGWGYTQAATPTGATNGASWFKDSNGVIFAHNGTRFESQPAVGYDETDLFDGTEGFTATHETPARTELVGGDLQLLPTQTVADFEDGTIAPEHPDWSWSAGSANVSTTTTQVISGTTSGVQTAVGALATSTLTRGTPIIQDWEFSTQIGADTSNINDYVAFEVYDGSATPVKLATITFNDGAGNVTVSHGDGAGATTTTEVMAGWAADTTYSFEFDWDFAANTFDLYEGGALVGSFNFEADAAASDFTECSIVNETTNSGVTRDVFLDDLVTGAREYGEVVITCPQPDSRIVDWDILRFDRTLATESVVVDVEDETGTQLIADIASNDDLSVAVDGATNPQVRVTFSRADVANTPTFNSLYRRWTMRPGDSLPNVKSQGNIAKESVRDINFTCPVQVDEDGRVTVDTDSRYANVTGDTLSGGLTFKTGVAAPLTFLNGSIDIDLDNGDQWLTMHDGNGNYNLKSGVDPDQNIVAGAGGTHVKLNEGGQFSVQVDTGTAEGGVFSNDMQFVVGKTDVTINGNTVWHDGNLENAQGIIVTETSFGGDIPLSELP